MSGIERVPAPVEGLWIGVKSVIDEGEPDVDRLFGELESLKSAEGDAAARRLDEVTRELSARLVPDPPVDPGPSIQRAEPTTPRVGTAVPRFFERRAAR